MTATTTRSFASPRHGRAARRLRADRVERIGWTGALHAITTPLIYAQALPLLLLDLFVTAYQWMCFPIYGVERVPRGKHFVLDRYRLDYLNPVEKLNCTYCAYANGVLAYVREVTARTEAYWCPIKHKENVREPHHLYEDFVAFGDAGGYRRGLDARRRRLSRRHRPKAPGE